MRSLIRRRGADATTVVLVGVLLNVAVFESLGSATSKLALFAAVAIAAEALQRPHDELLPDSLEGERFTLTAPIHLAAALVAGPWVAAAVAGWSVIAVGPFRGLAPMEMLRRAGALGASALREASHSSWPAEASATWHCPRTCCLLRWPGSCT